jgi:hypothetical protein
MHTYVCKIESYEGWFSKAQIPVCKYVHVGIHLGVGVCVGACRQHLCCSTCSTQACVLASTCSKKHYIQGYVVVLLIFKLLAHAIYLCTKWTGFICRCLFLSDEEILSNFAFF